MKSSNGLLLHLSNKAETLEEMVTFVNNKMNEWHRRRAWKTKLLLLEDVEKAVSRVVSQIQDLKSYPAMEGELVFKKEVLALLGSPSEEKKHES